MAIQVPSYLAQAHLQDPHIRYKWDDWDRDAPDEEVDDAAAARLAALSQRAGAAFGIATAEWIAYRFARLCDDPMPWQFLQSAWAQIVDRRYGASTIEGDTDRNQWVGPVRGPIWWALAEVDAALAEADEDGEPAVNGGRLVTLAEYVMADPGPYRKWRGETIDRLTRLYPLDPEDHLGDVVPREALDPNYPFQLDQTEPLINAFLGRLDPAANPFLSSPEDMVEGEFEGTPYVFDIDSDRRSRLEW